RSTAELRKNEAELSAMKQNIIFSVEELYLQLQNLDEKINITGESKLIAESSLKLTQERFDLKRASRIDLAEAELANKESLSNYRNAIYNYKIAKIRLESLLGE
ncbi:MAG: TolC family protein, partial [Thermodesulfobacteriota bacterium]